KCESLPSLGQLPSLKELLIQGMDEIKVIGLECTSTASVTFPSLEILKFVDMSSWEVWSTNSEVIFPCLQDLQIRNCPNLSDVSLEALPSLRLLTIYKCCGSVLRRLVRAASSTTKLEIRSILGLTDEVWRGVIENFGVVEELSIESCNEIRYLWESDVDASKVLVNLKTLEISECKKLVSLGEKEEDEDNIGSNLLSSLRKLVICSCESMERLCCPNSIESLHISGCNSIKQVSFPGATTTTGEGGQNLKSLNIWGHDMQMEKTNMPMLQDIDIWGWKNLKTINQLSNSTHLTSLSIRYCDSKVSFPDLQLSNLTRNMKEIHDLQLPNLISWSIIGCKNLESIPELWGLKNPITEWDYQNFPASLVELVLWNDKMESVSMGLQHITSLQHLDISRCPEGDAIEGVTHVSNAEHFDSIIKVEQCYAIEKFVIYPQRQYMPSVPHPASLKFGKRATFVPSDNQNIPTYYYSFASYDLPPRLKHPRLLTATATEFYNIQLESTTSSTFTLDPSIPEVRPIVERLRQLAPVAAVRSYIIKK
ncbi:hypothetical protein M8C21_029655, partial [Ambrosia artemisiifolia]